MTYSLTEMQKNQTAVIQNIGQVPSGLQITQEEFEKRLLEIGLDIGTPVTFLHEGPFGQDPIAIRIRNCYTVALRRSEAQVIQISYDYESK